MHDHTSHANPRKQNGNARRKIRAYLQMSQEPCWICKLPIDYSLGAPNKLAMVADELVPVSMGGSPYTRTNVRAAHWVCNSWRSTKPPQYVSVIYSMVYNVYHYSCSTPYDFVNCAKLIEKRNIKTHSIFETVSTDW